MCWWFAVLLLYLNAIGNVLIAIGNVVGFVVALHRRDFCQQRSCVVDGVRVVGVGGVRVVYGYAFFDCGFLTGFM